MEERNVFKINDDKLMMTMIPGEIHILLARDVIVWNKFNRLQVKGSYLPAQVCPGGGFGPVSDNGYGVSYMFAGDLTFFFHVSSKKSSTETDSQRFVDYLYESLKEMKELFQEKEDH